MGASRCNWLVLLHPFYSSFRLAEEGPDDGVAESLIRTELKAKGQMVEWLSEEIAGRFGPGSIVTGSASIAAFACPVSGNGYFLFLLFFEVDRLEFVAGDALANLGRGLACFVLREGIEGFFGAGGTFRAVQTFIATAQAGVAESAIAAAVAGELVEQVADLRSLLIDMPLPGILEVLAGELCAGKDGRQGRHLQGCGWMVGGHVIGRVGPLGVAGGGKDKYAKRQNPTVPDQLLHEIPSRTPHFNLVCP